MSLFFTRSRVIDWFKRIFNRLFYYPVRVEPCSFYRSSHFDPCGNPRAGVLFDENGEPAPEPPRLLNELDALRDKFYQRLRDARWRSKFAKSAGGAALADLSQYPGWDNGTVQHLYNLYLLYFNRENGLLGIDDFCVLCEDLGDIRPLRGRRVQFREFDADQDGWMDFQELLQLLYHFDPPRPPEQEGEPPRLGELAERCFAMAARAQLLAAMPIHAQLENGLF